MHLARHPLLTLALGAASAALGAEPVGNTPDEFAAFNRSELARWARIVKQSGAKID
jgi:tripartite-type tricarboxylate transporter receptor subunit TctC